MKYLFCHRIIIIAAGIFALVACNNKSDETQLRPAEYPITKVFTKDINIPLEFVANIQAIQNVEIRTRVEGYLEEIYVDEGKTITKGQPLFKINDQEYRAELNRAKANIASAEAETKSATVELERVKMLVDKDIIAQTELDLAEANLEIARSRIAQAKAEEVAAEIRLTNTSIRSPFDGVIDLLPFKRGSLIAEGALLTTVSDVHEVFAYFKVSEVEFLQFFKKNVRADTALMNNVELLLADGSVYSQKGKIETIESKFEEGTGAIAVRVRFSNPDRILKHGSSGRVRLHEVSGNAILIPQKATLEIQDKNYVLAVNKNNIVEMKSFIPLRRVGDYYIVLKGLAVNDLIVFEGIQDVREGMVITPRMITTDELLKSNPLKQE